MSENNVLEKNVPLSVSAVEDCSLVDMQKGVTPKVISIGTANPLTKYKQEDIIAMFKNVPKKVEKIFHHSHVKHRYLYLPQPDAEGKIPEESNEQLKAKHLHGVKDIGVKAIEECLSNCNVDVSSIDHFITVSSTGFLCPGISAHISKSMKFLRQVHRIDILGMGCNAGLNALQCASSLVSTGKNKKVLLLCIEICSAAYTHDGTVATGVVNSLFGDGAVAVLLSTEEEYSYLNTPKILAYQSVTMVEKIDLMEFRLVDNKLSFYISKETPYIIGTNVEEPVYSLLNKCGLKKRDIQHWIIHSGGKKVLDSIKYNLDLSSYDIRHTTHILEEYGNLSSCSVFFSLNSLLKERIAKKDDFGVAIAMGPGAGIETALLQW
jgi:predicted naringenin-chalcone synthase